MCNSFSFKRLEIGEWGGGGWCGMRRCEVCNCCESFAIQHVAHKLNGTRQMCHNSKANNLKNFFIISGLARNLAKWECGGGKCGEGGGMRNANVGIGENVCLQAPFPYSNCRKNDEASFHLLFLFSEWWRKEGREKGKGNRGYKRERQNKMLLSPRRKLIE